MLDDRCSIVSFFLRQHGGDDARRAAAVQGDFDAQVAPGRRPAPALERRLLRRLLILLRRRSSTGPLLRHGQTGGTLIRV